MIHKIFAVLDTKLNTYAQPFFMPTVPSALRAFAGACNDPSTMLSKHPTDFSLFLLGEFDDETGEVHSVKLENLGMAASFVRSTLET